jgi:hypothetical protein
VRYTINTQNDTVTITCTFGDLIHMAAQGASLWATPTPQGKANQVYMGTYPNFTYDFCLVRLEDFDESEGYDITAGWEDLDEGEDNPTEYTITVPRSHRPEEV